MYAFGNLGYNPGAVLDVIEDVAQRRIQEFTPQNVSNTVWGLAKLSAHPPHRYESCLPCIVSLNACCIAAAAKKEHAPVQVPSCTLQHEDRCRVRN